MKKKIIAAVGGLLVMFGMTATFANIIVNGHSSDFDLKTGSIEGKIVSVELAPNKEVSSSGAVKIEYKTIVMQIRSASNQYLFLDFYDNDLSTGIAMMNAIGKNIQVKLDADANYYQVYSLTFIG